MDGVFKKQKKGFVVFSLITGIILLIISLFILLIDGEDGSSSNSAGLLTLLLSLADSIVCVITLNKRRDASLHIGENRITGKTGRKKKLDAAPTDIRYADVQNDVLTLETADGKTYVFRALENAGAVFRLVQAMRLGVYRTNANIPELKKRLASVKRAEKILRFIALIFFFCLIAAIVMLSCSLYGVKLFSFMRPAAGAAACILAFCLMFLFLEKADGKKYSARKYQSLIRERTLYSAPLPQGSPRAVYINAFLTARRTFYYGSGGEEEQDFFTDEFFDAENRLTESERSFFDEDEESFLTVGLIKIEPLPSAFSPRF